MIAEALFLAYVVILGRRGVAANESGDIENAPDYAPAA
ncbi:membrane protein [Mycobacteroides abscessus]|nr:membrane protein [Mycobacteroides abscessus]